MSASSPCAESRLPKSASDERRFSGHSTALRRRRLIGDSRPPPTPSWQREGHTDRRIGSSSQMPVERANNVRTSERARTCPRLTGVCCTDKPSTRFAGASAKPSDGLEPSTPSLPWNNSSKRSQPRATVLASFRGFRCRRICHRLPPVATAGLHKGSILRCPDWLLPGLGGRAGGVTRTGPGGIRSS
jgi:hypothetical protein